MKITHLTNGTSILQRTFLPVLTFQITVYATHEKYSYCSKSDLNWNQTRCPKILQTITSTNADIVCLQEVQIDTWYSNILPYFQNTSHTNENENNNHSHPHPHQDHYTCILQNVTRNHPIACATLIKSSKFHIHTVESRSRALIVVLHERKESSFIVQPSIPLPPNAQSLVYIANVHLDARYDQDVTRYNQIKSLLHRIENHYNNHPMTKTYQQPPFPPPLRSSIINNITTEASQSSPNHNNTRTLSQSGKVTTTTTTYDNNQQLLFSSSLSLSSPRIIIAGDFNMLRSNPIYTLLSTGRYDKDVILNQKSISNMKKANMNLLLGRNKLTVPLPFLPLHDVHQNSYQPPSTHPRDSNIHQSTVRTAETIGTTSPSAATRAIHPLDIQKNTVPFVLRRTFASGLILDYIWFSAEQIQAVPWMIDPISSTTTTASTATTTNHKRNNHEPQRFRWPSKDQPSDHVPIGIRFFIR